tara:strand:+ start:615 stop:1013 length:399 start_codon:yes stop_codon:yes gene_type:complete
MEITITHIGGKNFKLAKRIYHKLSNNENIVIPIAFKTDLATAPVILWGFFPPYSDFLPAAIVHDWLYANKYVADGIVKGYDARLFADDEMLKLSMIHNNSKGFKGFKKRFGNIIRYLIVRCLGWLYWYDVIK